MLLTILSSCNVFGYQTLFSLSSGDQRMGLLSSIQGNKDFLKERFLWGFLTETRDARGELGKRKNMFVDFKGPS